MKLRNTLLLLLLALGLFAFIFFYERKLPSTRDATDREARVVSFDQSKITGVSLVNNEQKIELRKGVDGHWMLDAPVKDRADEGAVTELLGAVEMLRKETTLESRDGKDPVRDVGLAKPNVSIKLLGPDAPSAILFGKDAAVEGKQYVRLENSKSVFVVRNDLKAQLAKKADDFRDRRLTDLSGAQVNKALIKTAAGEIEVQKEREHWSVNKPLKARGDDAKISDLIAGALTARIETFVSGADSAAANAALNDTRGSVTLSAEGADKPLTLQFSKPLEKTPDKVFAKLSGRDAVFTLPKKAADILDVKPNDLRDKQLVRLNLDTVDRIHLAPAGRPEITLARKGENWVLKSLGDKPANGAEVQRLAQTLQTQTVSAFVSDIAADLPKYGLDHPALRVTFSAYASENTAESKAGEQSVAGILFGKTEGENVYAKIEEEPFIVSVPKTLLDGIFTDPLQWQDLAIFTGKAEDITTMEVTRAGPPPLSLRREKAVWKPATGDVAINAAAAQSLANTLATLRAVRWAGAPKPEHGLDKQPEFAVAWTTADKKTHRLRMGQPTPDGFWFAALDGADGIFVLGKPDHDAITAPLTANSAAASPSPSASIPASGAATPDAGAPVTTTPVEAPAQP